jgi:prevent-host-death family protein
MKASANMDMINMVERLIPISEFSKGKTSHIFDDVRNNHSEYIILKNNQPTAVLISVEEYKKAKQLGAYLEQIEERALLEQAMRVQAGLRAEDSITLDALMEKYDIDPSDVDAAMEGVEIE